MFLQSHCMTQLANGNVVYPILAQAQLSTGSEAVMACKLECTQSVLQWWRNLLERIQRLMFLSHTVRRPLNGGV